MEGLSFTNLGLMRIVTPSEVAAQAEQMAQNKAQTVIKNVEGLEKSKADVEGERDPNGGGEGRFTDFEEEESDKLLTETEENIKKYKVKFNAADNMIELIDRSTGIIIETIAPGDLVNLLSKSKQPLGILVDKEV